MFSDVVRHVIQKIKILKSYLLNIVYIVVFDVETALENLKLAILERLELDFFFSRPPNHGRIDVFPPENYSVFKKVFVFLQYFILLINPLGPTIIFSFSKNYLQACTY